MVDKQSGAGSTGDQDKDKGLSNAEVKAHPLFQKLTAELSETRKTNESMKRRLGDLEEAENARQTKAAEKKGDYEKATQKRIDKAVNDAREQWNMEQSAKDKTSEAKLLLVKAGFKNDKWLNGALAEFDPEKGTAEDFAKAMAEDESNKAFLESVKGPTQKADPHPAGHNGSKILTPEQIQALRSTGKPEDASRADDAAMAAWTAANKGLEV